MRFVRGLLLAWLASMAPAFAQNPLPDLGGEADAVLAPQVERRVGEEIMRDIRYRDPTYLDDAEVSDYLNVLGGRLSAAAPDTRQQFDFFPVQDPTLNAFALPGGFIGVHTGLILATGTESELASVLAHEISHVIQRHIARLLGAQRRMQVPMLAALAAAIVLGSSRPDLAVGAAAAAQASGIQSALNYTRSFEHEADRIGFRMLVDAGFDGSGMARFFEQMQRLNRVGDDGSLPPYLRTHPLDAERIADAQGRAAGQLYRQRADSEEFQLVRAKLRAASGTPREAVLHFRSAVAERRFASEAAARYGLASALLRDGQVPAALAEIERVRALGAKSYMIDTLHARAVRAAGDPAAALEELLRVERRFPNRLPIVFDVVEALLAAGRGQAALDQLAEPISRHPREARLYSLKAKSYALLGKRALQHQAQAEAYVRQGSLPAAIEQLQIAQRAGDGNFYQLSEIDARLRALRAEHAQRVKDPKP